MSKCTKHKFTDLKEEDMAQSISSAKLLKLRAAARVKMSVWVNNLPNKHA